jgi:hypothetical protein
VAPVAPAVPVARLSIVTIAEPGLTRTASEFGVLVVNLITPPDVTGTAMPFCPTALKRVVPAVMLAAETLV